MTKSRLVIDMPAELKQQIKVKAYTEGKTVTQKVLELLKVWLDQLKSS